MKKSAFKLLIGLSLVLISASGMSAELIKEFKGSHSKETLEFEVKSPWILDWRMSTEYPGQMGVEIWLVEAGSGAFQGSVLKTKWPGNGVRLFEEGGKYQFKIVSHLANWTLKIKQLTREEAKLYTPKTRD